MKAAVKGSQKAKTFPSPNRPQLCRDVSERPPPVLAPSQLANACFGKEER